MSEDLTIHFENDRERIVSTIDTFPTEPENEGGCPVFRIWSNNVGCGQIHVDLVYGTGTAKVTDPADPEAEIDAHVNYLREQLRYLLGNYSQRKAIEIFTRWLKLCFDGQLVEYGPNPYTDYVYLALIDAPLRSYWGCENDTEPPELDEIQAWIEGDCYLVRYEKLSVMESTHTETDVLTGDERYWETTQRCWNTVETIGGIYGTSELADAVEETKAYLHG